MAKQQPQKASTPQPPVAAAPIPLLQPRAFGAVDQPSLGESPQADMESKLDGVALGHSLGRINTRPLSHLPIQPKLTIGQVGDPYEQEADRVAAQVVSQIHAPKPQTVALPKLQSKAALRRKALSVSIQRQEAPEEDELQMKPLAESIQRSEAPEEEDELQMKPLADSIQRQEAPEEDELQMKPLAESIQRSEAPEEDELQMKPTVQRKADPGGSAASANLETSINQARGGGQGMSDSIRQPMEQAFGADFSSVRVHTGSQADQLSRSINAQAFTTKNDIFFSQGAYNPGDRGGQELLAHELTHVVQQTGGGVQRQVQKAISTTTQQSSIQRTVDHAKQLADLYDPKGSYEANWETLKAAKKNFLPYQWERIHAASNLDKSGKPQLWDRLGNKVDESPLNKREQGLLDAKMQELDSLDKKRDPELGLNGIHKSILLYLEGTIRDRLGDGGVAQFYKGAHIILKDNGEVYEQVQALGMPIAATKKNGDIKSKTEFVGKTGTNYGGWGGDPEAQRSGKMFTRRPENSETSHYQPNIVDDPKKPLPYKDQGYGYGLGLRTKYEQKNTGYDIDATTVKPQLGIDLPESVKGHILVGVVPPHLGDDSKNDAVGHTFVQTEGAGFQNFHEASLAHGQGFLANTGVTDKKGTQTGLVGTTLHSEKITAKDQEKNPDARAEIREQDQHPLGWDWNALLTEAMQEALAHNEYY